MLYLWISLGILAFAAIVTLTLSYLCYRIAFRARKKTAPAEEFPLPKGDAYEPFHDAMRRWMIEVRAMPHETFTIRSFDGLQLRGKFYEYAPGAPMELMFHGYRGNAERDLCGGIQRSFALGRSVFLVDQRSSEGSEGNVISFGINEHKDCLAWVDFLISHFGPDVKIILTGISMGAATVLMAAGCELPPNVIGVLADCGYTTAKAIILKVIGSMGLPAKLLYPFVKLGARLFGRFNLEAFSPLEAVQRCRLPVIFIHGARDGYVPSHMSRENFEACAGPKQLVIIPDADHGLSYLVDPDGYLTALRDFFAPYL